MEFRFNILQFVIRCFERTRKLKAMLAAKKPVPPSMLVGVLQASDVDRLVPLIVTACGDRCVVDGDMLTSVTDRCGRWVAEFALCSWGHRSHVVPKTQLTCCASVEMARLTVFY